MPRPDARLLSAHRSDSPPLFFPPVNSQQRAVRAACPSDRATSPCCATPVHAPPWQLAHRKKPSQAQASNLPRRHLRSLPLFRLRRQGHLVLRSWTWAPWAQSRKGLVRDHEHGFEANLKSCAFLTHVVRIRGTREARLASSIRPQYRPQWASKPVLANPEIVQHLSQYIVGSFFVGSLVVNAVFHLKKGRLVSLSGDLRRLYCTCRVTFPYEGAKSAPILCQ